MAAARFLFETDFRNPQGAAKSAAELQSAEDRGFAAGLAEGRRQGEAEASAALACAIGRVGDAVERMLGTVDARAAALEDDALAFALALARKIAGDALADRPLAPVAEAARQALQHLRGVPHVAVRCHEGLVEDVDQLLRRIARERGYEGRVVVLGEPDIAPGDVRIDWADGGVSWSRADLDAALARALSGHRPGPS